MCKAKKTLTTTAWRPPIKQIQKRSRMKKKKINDNNKNKTAKKKKEGKQHNKIWETWQQQNQNKLREEKEKHANEWKRKCKCIKGTTRGLLIFTLTHYLHTQSGAYLLSCVSTHIHIHTKIWCVCIVTGILFFKNTQILMHTQSISYWWWWWERKKDSITTNVKYWTSIFFCLQKC